MVARPPGCTGTEHRFPYASLIRAGKGAATLLGALAVIWPSSLPWFVACWLIIIGSSGYVGLATMLAALSLIVQAALAGGALRLGFVADRKSTRLNSSH